MKHSGTSVEATVQIEIHVLPLWAFTPTTRWGERPVFRLTFGPGEKPGDDFERHGRHAGR